MNVLGKSASWVWLMEMAKRCLLILQSNIYIKRCLLSAQTTTITNVGDLHSNRTSSYEQNKYRSRTTFKFLTQLLGFTGGSLYNIIQLKLQWFHYDHNKFIEVKNCKQKCRKPNIGITSSLIWQEVVGGGGGVWGGGGLWIRRCWYNETTLAYHLYHIFRYWWF